MSTKSGVSYGTNKHKMEKLLSEISPRSLTSNENDEVVSLSDTSNDTNTKREMPIWPGSSNKNDTPRVHDESDYSPTSRGDDEASPSAMLDKKATTDAATVAAEALGKDLEAMGYDLECRSFIKKRGEDSFTSKSLEEDAVERYTVAPFSEEDETKNADDVIKLLRSTSDLIEATRSSSDFIVALRSLSSEEQDVHPIGSVLSSGTGPMMIISPPSIEAAQDKEAPSVPEITSASGRISCHVEPSQPSDRSVRSQKSVVTTKSNRTNKSKAISTTASVKSRRSQNTTHTSRSRRSSKTPVEDIPMQQSEQRRIPAAPVLVETVTSIPSTLSQYNVQYTTTASTDDNQPLLLTVSPSQKAMTYEPKVNQDETILVCANTEEKESNDEVAADRTKLMIVTKKSKSKGSCRNLETGSYHIASTLPSPMPEVGNNNSSKDGSSERLPKLLRSASEGGKARSIKQFTAKRSPIRQMSSQKDGTVKSRRSYWSGKGVGSKSRTSKCYSTQENDDDASEVSSVASSRASPPFPILSIPMKSRTMSTNNKSAVVSDSLIKRPPRAPNSTSSQRSKGSISKHEVVIQQGYIETKRSVDSRTLEEMSPEGMEMTAVENQVSKVERDVSGNNNSSVEPMEYLLYTVPSVESKVSTKNILKAFSMGSKASKSKCRNDIPTQPNKLPIPEDTTKCETSHIKEDMLGITSDISVEEDKEEAAKEKEQIARQLILANMVERQRRAQRSMQARDKLLKLVHEKGSGDKFETMTLPPTFERTNPTMRSAVTAPAQMKYLEPPMSPATATSVTTMPREDLTSNNHNFLETCDDSIVSDATPKTRGGARIFSFLSFSPEKRRRDAVEKKSKQASSKLNSSHAPTGRRNSKTSSSTLPIREEEANVAIVRKGKKKVANRPKKSKTRPSIFSIGKKKKASKLVSQPVVELPKPDDVFETTIIESMKEQDQIMKKNPKVTYVDLDDSFEAIEVAFSTSPQSYNSPLPPMLGTDAILEKIVEEGSYEDLRSIPSDQDNAPVYNVKPLMISPMLAISTQQNEDMLTLTRKAALDDLKKVGASMIANASEVSPRNNKEEVIVESVESPTKQTHFSFLSAVDKWFFDPLGSKQSSIDKKHENPDTAKATDWAKEGKQLTEAVLSGSAFTSDEAKPMSKDREETLEYLDQELKSREESSLKSLTELEEKMLDGSVVYNRTVPTHLTLNHMNQDDSSCLTALDSTLTRKFPSKNNIGNVSTRNDDVSTLSDVLTMDQWNEIAEAAYTVERALKKIEQSGGLQSAKSDANSSKPSFAFINDDVEEALHVLSKHAARLGISESDILLAFGGSTDDGTELEGMDQSILAQQLSRSPGPRRLPRTDNEVDGETITVDDATATSPTIGEEIFEVLKMYMAKSK
jgi:hypothetical protein